MRGVGRLAGRGGGKMTRKGREGERKGLKGAKERKRRIGGWV